MKTKKSNIIFAGLFVIFCIALIFTGCASSGGVLDTRSTNTQSVGSITNTDTNIDSSIDNDIPYSARETNGGTTHYLLSISFEEALEKLNQYFGTNYQSREDMGFSRGPSSTLIVGSNPVILEESSNGVRLVKIENQNQSGVQWRDKQNAREILVDAVPPPPPYSNWVLVDGSSFGTSHIRGIAYGDGKFVAGGQDGKIAYSTDGVNWTAVNNSIFGSSEIRRIIYGNNRFVAAGGSGKIAYSTDGVNWTAVSNSTFGTTLIRGIAYGNGKFVAVGEDGGKIAYSTDGISWTAVSNSSFGTSPIRGIAYGDGKFVAGGTNGKIAYSTDGVTWTAVSNSTFGSDGFIVCVYYEDGKFIAGGFSRINNSAFAYSIDGMNWISADYPNQINEITYGDGWFVASDYYGKMTYSSDGVNWTESFDSGSNNGWINGIAYNDHRFIGVGDNGIIIYSD